MEVLEALDGEGLMLLSSCGGGKLAGLFDGGVLEAFDGYDRRCFSGFCSHGWIVWGGRGGIKMVVATEFRGLGALLR